MADFVFLKLEALSFKHNPLYAWVLSERFYVSLCDLGFKGTGRNADILVTAIALSIKLEQVLCL